MRLSMMELSFSQGGEAERNGVRCSAVCACIDIFVDPSMPQT